jgi:hypothetical protein
MMHEVIGRHNYLLFGVAVFAFVSMGLLVSKTSSTTDVAQNRGIVTTGVAHGSKPLKVEASSHSVESTKREPGRDVLALWHL